MKKIVTQIAKFFVYIACYIFYPFSFLFPRSKRLYAYGSYRGAFNDNSKYLFLYANKNVSGVRHIWLSTKRATVKYVRSLGFEAYWIGSILGIWYALRSRYWFVNSYTSDILFFLSGGAKVVNLWHGVPMKCIEFGITKGELAKRYKMEDKLDMFFHPAAFRRPDFFASTTPFFDEVFTKSFRISKSQCIHVCCARDQFLLQPAEKALEHVSHFEPKTTEALIQKMQQYDRVYVYMPTWRDSQLEIFANGFDLDQFNEVLKSKNYLTLMKPHINTRFDWKKEYSNLVFLEGGVDMYPILPFTDVLITDYSGTIYDYLLMPNKGIILFHYDYEEYIQDREFIFPIDQEITGKRVYSFEELLQAIMTNDDAVNEVDRKRIIAKFWGNTINEEPCKATFKQLGLPC